MNARSLSISLAVLGASLAIVPPAGAHRVDEYLQATLLSIDVDRVDLEIDLTAGVALASRVFGWIDTNGDGEISGAEGEAYARQVLGSVVLKVDGWPVPVTLVGSNFPPFPEMSLGLGIIRLRATAKFPVTGAGNHQISFLNTHRSESSVYMVNALVPVNPRIQLADQRRDVAQHGLTLEYQVKTDAGSPPDRNSALLVGLALAGCLYLRYGRVLTQGGSGAASANSSSPEHTPSDRLNRASDGQPANNRAPQI